MTNAEKYLKDNVSVEELAKEFQNFVLEHSNIEPHTYENEMKEFLRAECKPTLTEDERVILRNIDPRECNVIGRDKNTKELYLAYSKTTEMEDREYIFDVIFPNLFQFIKNGEEYSIEELLKYD